MYINIMYTGNRGIDAYNIVFTAVIYICICRKRSVCSSGGGERFLHAIHYRLRPIHIIR